MKRLTNTTGIKVKFIPQTNTNPARLRITQTNFNKSVTVSADNHNVLEFSCGVLESIESIKSYSMVVDNTQTDYYLFSVDFKGNEFINILNELKK